MDFSKKIDIINFSKKIGFIGEFKEIKEKEPEYIKMDFSHKTEPKCGICNKQLNLKIYKSKKLLIK